MNINLEIIETNSFKTFFDGLIKKKNFAIYWNKVYEPNYLKFDEYLINSLKNKNIKQEKKTLYLKTFFLSKIIINGRIDKNTKGYVIDLIVVEKPKNNPAIAIL